MKENFTEEIAEARALRLRSGRATYFRAADAALEKIRLRFGEGREGFLHFLNNNDVGRVKPHDEEPG